MRAVLATLLCCLVAPVLPAAQEEESDRIETVNAFRAARDAGDYELARSFLSDAPRVWYEARDGEGSPLKLGAGRFAEWDDHFNGVSELEPWTAERNVVWTVAEETNDYYRLIERRDVSRYRITYFFDGQGKIEGSMISAARPDHAPPEQRDRFDEFEAWARANHPQEWEYLRPGGELDPTGDRAQRTRLLLEAWRREVGLPVLNGERSSHGVFTGELKPVLYVDIKAADAAYATAWLANDPESVMATLTEDAVIIPSGMPAIEGAAAIREFWWPPGSSSTTVTEFTLVQHDHGHSTGLAYVRGSFSLVFQNDGKTYASDGEYLSLLRCLSDGSWRIARRMWSDGTRSVNDLEQYVESDVIVSRSLPAIRVRVDDAFEYVGRFPFAITDVAEGERFVFVDATGGLVERLFVAQFEHFRPEVDEWYRYSFDDALEFSGHRFRQNTYAYSNADAADANPEGEGVLMAAFLRDKGYRLEDELMMSRFVTVAGAANKHELILFYIENVSKTGHRLSEFYDARGVDTEAWKAISDGITERSSRQFEVLAESYPEE